MNGIKRSFLFLCLCMGLLSCGCQETPEKAPENTEQVKDNANQQGDNHQTQDSEITYCTVAELREVKMPKVE